MEYEQNPIITSALALEWHERSQVPKPTALGTKFRFSSAYGCGRQQGYAAFEATPTEPMDEAGAWVTGLGTLIHESVQEAIARKFPSAQFEVASGDDVISGSCDALISVHDVGSHYGGTHVLWELKTMGTYSFDKQVGWNRMRGEFKSPEGPAQKAVTQAGMNALMIEQRNPDIRIESLVLGSITFESLSKQKADKMGVWGLNRFLAEFTIPRSEWEPLAQAEFDRVSGLSYNVEHGYLPDRIALDDDGNFITLNPDRSSNWQCEYCAFKTTCRQDGPGQVYVMDSAISNKGDN
jgi:hypothetical protein